MYGGNGQFDGIAAFSGGGFIPSQTTQTAADTSHSPAKNSDTQTLIPLTVKQIRESLQSSDDKMNFTLDGVDVNNVKLVGLLLNKAERVTDVQFIIDDGTGRIDCFRVNEFVDSKEMERVMNGMYVVVHRHLKGFQGKKQMMVYSVRSCKRIPVLLPGYQTQLSKLLQKATRLPHQISVDELRGTYKLVLDYLQQPQSVAREEGVHCNVLAQQLNVPLEKSLEAIESLESERLVYSTIDECHYKSTANS